MNAASSPVARPQRGFWCLFATQFQGALSDNLFKFLVIYLITSTRPAAERDQLIAVALALFAVPFVLFSMAGGFLADRFTKARVIQWVKVAEVGIMALGAVGLVLAHLPLLLGVLFLMSVQSAFFGPAKYGSLPELLPAARLSWGNGWINFGTFFAIIAGGVLAGWLHKEYSAQPLLAGSLLLLLSGIGVATSRGITALPAANPGKQFQLNPLADLWQHLRAVGRDRVLALAMVGSVYFWFIGALFGEPTILTYSQDVLKLDEQQISLLRAALAVGIGLGSVAAGVLSARKIEYGLVPLGGLGLAAGAGLLAVPGWTPLQVGVILAGLGFAGGFFIVPLSALIQHRPEPREKGAIIATNAWLTSVGVFVASGAFWLLKTALGLSAAQIFLVGALLTFGGTIYALALVPDALLRLGLWAATHTIYRVRVLGRENVPARGGALLVCNHLSLADAVILQSATDRPIRFIMLKAIYEQRWIRPWARVMRAIPISSELRPREMIQALQTASAAIRQGELVCIFAEGQITRIGQLLPFRRGFERIMQGQEAPIIPVALDGVWGSLFSFAGGKFIWKLPHRWPHPLTVNFGGALPPTAKPLEVRQAVQELMAAAWPQRRAEMLPLARALIRTARRIPFRLALADAQSPRVSFAGALTRSILLARRLRPVWAAEQQVGLLLPPSVGGALANWAALLAGKVPVNLNYTLAPEALAACQRQCDIKLVLTSRTFLAKAKLAAPAGAVFLEDVVAALTWREKISAWGAAWFVPARWLEQWLQTHPAPADRLDALATVIFSSGSTGNPKGVMLSHYNVGSNIEQLGQVFGFRAQDRMLGVLPFFHSFGFTGTLLLPAVLGLGVVYHPNPLDAKAIGALVQEQAVSFLLATPTFLQFYLRGCTAEQFGSIRLVAVGAEKLPERLATAFEEQFGVRPFEAYGCTECAPAVTVNTPDFRAAGFRQVGAKRGKIGHPLPGVSVRIVDADTRQPLAIGQPGLLLVRGPNVMCGYLGRPDLTAAVLRDGWYDTGDIAMLDEDGFIQITDRLSRFSKIGGEMVPHLKVEEKLHELAAATEQSFVVTSVADERKGERLLVLHKLAPAPLAACLEQLAAAGDLPNLWKPKAEAFVRVESFPLLGTGKLDLRRVKELAQQAVNSAGA